jgi:hypothetical protein
MAEFAQALAECVDRGRRRGGRAARDDPDPGELSLRLRPGGERRGEEAAYQGANEGSPVHYSIT